MSLVIRARLPLLALLVVLGGIALPAPALASTSTEAQRVIRIAENQIGDRYQFASTGPNSFDCSGFVYFVYKRADLLNRIGGRRRTVAGFHKWFANHGKVTRSLSSARPGDLLVWGRNKHIGIYVGNGYAISALVNPYGVRRHRVNGIHLKLTAVLHVRLTR